MGLFDKLRNAFSGSKAVEVQPEATADDASKAVTAVAEGKTESLNITFKGDFTFDTNSDKIHPELNAELDNLAQALVSAAPQAVVQIEGHTDSSGRAEYNQQLSEKRAASVKAALVKRGVDASRISTRGCGETTPIADNNTPEGKKKNRRVEIKITNPTATA